MALRWRGWNSDRPLLLAWHTAAADSPHQTKYAVPTSPGQPTGGGGTWRRAARCDCGSWRRRGEQDRWFRRPAPITEFQSPPPARRTDQRSSRGGTTPFGSRGRKQATIGRINTAERSRSSIRMEHRARSKPGRTRRCGYCGNLCFSGFGAIGRIDTDGTAINFSLTATKHQRECAGPTELWYTLSGCRRSAESAHRGVATSQPRALAAIRTSIYRRAGRRMWLRGDAEKAIGRIATRRIDRGVPARLPSTKAERHYR